MSGKPISCNAHQTNGLATIESVTIAATQMRRRLFESQRTGATSMSSVGKLRSSVARRVILVIPNWPTRSVRRMNLTITPYLGAVNDRRTRHRSAACWRRTPRPTGPRPGESRPGANLDAVRKKSVR